MKPFPLVISLICTVYSAKETMYDLLTIVNNPKLLAAIEKRLRDGRFEDDSLSTRHDDDSCYASSGTIRNDCSFYSNASTIIKTKESLARGAKYLRDFSNISCPKECTALCCENSECDVSIYQDKEEHSCYLFKCGEPSQCVFYVHANYWMSSISETISKTHIYTPGVATHSHENELANLHEDTTSLGVKTTPTSKKDVTTTKKPGLGSYCDSYKTECEDPHAECRFKTCRCKVAYHSKYGICRKHCGDEEFECENIAYGTDSAGQCIQNQFVCDGNSDCIDGSDELDCTNKKDLNEVLPVRSKVQTTQRALYTTTEVTKTSPINQHTERAFTTDVISKSMVTAKTEAVQVSPETNKPTIVDPVSDHQKSLNQFIDRSKNSNISTAVTKMDNDSLKASTFHILNADSVEVLSYTDSSQGPIIALALGLAITLFLLIFVGCRLRTVKRRLRKGRALQSNEADYLINGMYL